MSVNTPTLITFVIYIAAMVLIGLAAYRSTNNFSACGCRPSTTATR